MSDINNTYDVADAKEFLEVIDPSEEARFSFVAFQKLKEGKPKERPPLNGKLDDHLKSLTLLQEKRMNVTIVVQENEGGIGKANITRLRAAFIDFDSKLVGTEQQYGERKRVCEALDLEALQNSSMPPHLIVESSPGNYHAYWALQERTIENSEEDSDAVAEAFKTLQRNLAFVYSSDPTITNINRCMRVPGFWLFKDDEDREPSRPRIVWRSDSDFRYSAHMLAENMERQIAAIYATRAATGAGKGKGKAKAAAQAQSDQQAAQADQQARQNFNSNEARESGYKALRKLCEELANMPEGGRDTKLNEVAMTAGGFIASGRVDEADAKEMVAEAARACGLDEATIKDKLKRVIEDGKRKPLAHTDDSIQMNKPRRVARKFLMDSFVEVHNGKAFPTLIYWAEKFYHHSNGSYHEFEKGVELEDKVESWLYQQKVKRPKPEAEGGGFQLVSFSPKDKDVNEIMKALQRLCFVRSLGDANAFGEKLSANSWIPVVEEKLPMGHIVPLKNGLYDAKVNELRPGHPGLFNHYVCTVDFNPEVSIDKWLSFLDQIFTQSIEVYDEASGDYIEQTTVDQAQIELLQEWFGYCLTACTDAQKMAMLLGPPRSGKGTIMRVLEAILGGNGCTAFDVRGLISDFGTENFIGKVLATCGDVRMDAKHGKDFTDMLLRIVGQDSIAINRKNLKRITIPVQTRMFMAANEMPPLMDNTSAIKSRMLIIRTHQSFVGSEDFYLMDKLRPELPGIIAWAIEGLHRLLNRSEFGYRFTKPASSEEAYEELQDAGNPLVAFIAQRVDIGRRLNAHPDAVFDEYLAWAKESNMSFTKTRQQFKRDFKSAMGDSFKVRQTAYDANSPRQTYWGGFGLRRDPNKESYSASNPPGYTRPNLPDMPQDDRFPPPHGEPAPF